METYPYDWKGTNPLNAFKEDRIIQGDNPTDRVIILKNRPFFAANFSVTSAGADIPLTLGVDYELVYEMPELDDSLASAVFNGIQLINPDIGGAIVCKGQQLGGSFYTPFVEMLDEIVKYLNNPVDADWFKVENRPTFYPPMMSATSWADLLNKKYLASAVHDVELNAEAANDLIKAALDSLKKTVAALGAEITAFNYPAHIAAKNPHNTTATQANVHPVSLKTPDTFLAYGKTLRQLTSEIRALGLKQSDIDLYIEKWASNPVTGVFVQQLAANRSLFKSADGTSEITFTDTSFILKSNGSIILTAGYSSTDATVRFMEWVSGVNTLRIESSGNALGMDKLTLNGKVLLTTTLLMKYQPTGDGSTSTDPDEQKVYIQGKGGLNFTGEGKKSDPIKGTLTVPTATTAIKGVAKLKSGPGTETSGVAATPDSLQPYEGKAGDYVPKTTMLNSVAMDDGQRVLTKTDIGLGSADNTADVDKPLSSAQIAKLQGLSPKVHQHDFAELELPLASASVSGLARYTDLDDGLAGSKGVTPNLLKRLSDRLDIIGDAVANVRVGMSSDFSVIDAARWNIASNVATVSGLRYFYLKDGVRDEGRVDGSINLATSPMFNWFSPDNTMETAWRYPVLNVSSALPVNFASPPPLPFHGMPVGMSATDMGDISVKSLLTKIRVKTVTGALNIYATGGGRITVYVDGVQVAQGAAPLKAAVDVDKSRESYCIGIRVDCNDSTVAAAMAYEIYDEEAPLLRSGTSPVTYLAEFVPTTTNYTRYLYLNMLTEALFCREEPILSSDIDLEHSLIGVIRAGKNGPDKVYNSEAIRDYGPSKELTDHIAREDVHLPEIRDWKITDNPLLPLVGRLRLSSRGDIISPDTTVSMMDPAGVVVADMVKTRTGKYYLLLEALDQTPQSWFTANNPHADGHPTLEGGLLADVECKGVPFAYNNFELLFVGPDSTRGAYKTSSHVRLTLKPTENARFGAITNFGMSSSNTAGGAKFEEIATYNAVKVIRNETLTGANDYKMFGVPSGTNQAARVMIRYRYDYKTRVLRVVRHFFKGGAGDALVPIEVLELEYTFDVNISNFIRGGVGIGFDAGTPTSDEKAMLMAHVLPVNEDPSFDYKRYHYYRGLYEGYVGSNPTESIGQAMKYEALMTDDTAYHSDRQFLSLGLGGHQVSWDSLLPHCLARNADVKASRLAVTALSSKGKWCVPWGDSEKFRLLGPLAVRYSNKLSKPVYNLSLKIRSSLPGKVWVGHTSVDFAAKTDSALTVPMGFSYGDGRDYLPFWLQFTPNGNTVFNCSFEFSYLDVDGNVILTVTETDGALELFDGGPRYTYTASRPTYITTAGWDAIKALMATERAAGSGTFGVLP